MNWTISSSSSSATSHDLLAAHDIKAFIDGKALARPSLTVFSSAELKEATKNFHSNLVLGDGEFGYVYKGMLPERRLSQEIIVVIVEKLKPEFCQGVEEWQKGIRFLGSLSHPNLAKLLGYSYEDKELALVYKFMEKGSLANHLFGKSLPFPLPWDERFKIAVGAARGLAYLHSCERKLTHGNFKTSNILLDGSYTAKLTDFGLVRSGPQEGETHVTARVMGTHGYAAPEYIATGHLYVKSDVYGFGVVLLEILTGLIVIDRSRPKGRENLVEWVIPLLSSKRNMNTIMDSRLKGDYSSHRAFQIALVALKCLQETPDDRPSMTEVVKDLELIEVARANRIPKI